MTSRPPWAAPAPEVAQELHTSLRDGLSVDEAAARLARDGANELDEAPPIPRWRRFVRQFTDPLVLMLLAAIAISLGAWAADDSGGTPIEAVVIAAIVVLNAVIGYWQEARAIEAVAALRRLSATHTTVVRGGEPRSIPTAELVVGDLVVLAEGDAVGADVRLAETSSLRIVESALTGESAPVDKSERPVPAGADLGERVGMVFKGTAVARGHGTGVVVATGMRTEIGRIAELLGRTAAERTPLQRQIAWLGRTLGIGVMVLAVIVVGSILLASDVHTTGAVLEAGLVGVSLAVAAVPEGLPAILTVVLALGVQRMAARRAVVKKLSSVETLGSASVICTDKTGTLTRNEMTIVEVVTPSAAVGVTGIGFDPIGHLELDGRPLVDPVLRREVELVLSGGGLANDASVGIDDDGRWEIRGDPTEAAFLVAERKLELTAAREHRFERVADVPFDSERKMMTAVHLDREGEGADEVIAVTKGAPDVLLERCTHERVAGRVVPLTALRRRAITDEVDRLADGALRTLAVAYRPLGAFVAGPEGPAQIPVDESVEFDLIHLGVVGIIDPPRTEAAEAIADAHRAGIRVVMITGDHQRTAGRIGQQLGLSTTGSSVTGRELAGLDDSAFTELVSRETVFSRVAPEHKLRIVEALQAQGEIVAMTGDGVNDAPALKQADIGVAMGITGTEVSKEAADMILADDNFATILGAVREGREIFADIAKFIRYLLSSNTGEVLVMLVGVLAAGAIGLSSSADGLAVPLLATHILWINLLTDSTLALALGVDPAVDDLMSRPPRRIDDRIVDRAMLVSIALVGTTSAVAGLVALDLELAGGFLGGSGGVERARTMLFSTVVLAQVFNAFCSRSAVVSAFVRPFENRLLWGAALLTVVLQVAVVHAPPLQRAFDTVALDAGRWALCVALASSVLVVEEVRKVIARVRTPS